MSTVINPTQFNANNVTGTAPIRKGDRLQALLLYSNTPFLLETPALKVPFGVNRFGEKSDGTIDASKVLGAYSMNMSAQPKDNTPERLEVVKSFFDNLEEMDTVLLKYGMEHSKAIFGKVHQHEAVVEALFTPTIKRSEDKEGNPYPHRIAPKIPADYDDETRPNVKVFQDTQDDLNVEGYTFSELKETVGKGTFVAAILQPRLWFISGKYGITWKVVQMKVHAKKTFGKPTSYAFSDNTSDNEQPAVESDNETSSESEKQPVVEKEDSVVEDSEEDEESEEEEEEEVTA
tara:strand:- start:882 stop:1751 length:870 start_codon:yes stop_codon:yes gene_type:complete